MINLQTDVQAKNVKGLQLLDLLVLQSLKTKPMQGCEVITTIIKDYGICFDSSTICPILDALEKKKYVQTQWDKTLKLPQKVYHLTVEGQTMLNSMEGFAIKPQPNTTKPMYTFT